MTYGTGLEGTGLEEGYAVPHKSQQALKLTN